MRYVGVGLVYGYRYTLGLLVPAVSAAGVLLIGTERSERRPIDWRILGGGAAFGAAIQSTIPSPV